MSDNPGAIIEQILDSTCLHLTPLRLYMGSAVTQTSSVAAYPA